jgi:DNA-binding transcriptional regulator YhcF (GntR family)
MCVAAIIKVYAGLINPAHADLINPENWKRRSKKVSGNTVVRVFENLKTKDIVQVDDINGSLIVNLETGVEGKGTQGMRQALARGFVEDSDFSKLTTEEMNN